MCIYTSSWQYHKRRVRDEPYTKQGSICGGFCRPIITDSKWMDSRAHSAISVRSLHSWLCWVPSRFLFVYFVFTSGLSTDTPWASNDPKWVLGTWLHLPFSPSFPYVNWPPHSFSSSSSCDISLSKESVVTLCSSEDLIVFILSLWFWGRRWEEVESFEGLFEVGSHL